MSTRGLRSTVAWMRHVRSDKLCRLEVDCAGDLEEKRNKSRRRRECRCDINDIKSIPLPVLAGDIWKQTWN